MPLVQGMLELDRNGLTYGHHAFQKSPAPSPTYMRTVVTRTPPSNSLGDLLGVAGSQVDSNFFTSW